MPPDGRYTIRRLPLQQSAVPPVKTKLTDDGTLFIDFGQAAFGTLTVPTPNAVRRDALVVHLGEQVTAAGRLERAPAGTIRHIRIEQEIDPHLATTRIMIPPDKRNTGPAAIRMPPEIGEVFPFRYAEIEDGANLDISAIRQIRVHYPFDDAAASFDASDPVLNAIWNLCKYSIKATTFCGVYVDGDRERIPYEGDAYINQLGHYCVDQEYTLARYTHEYLIQHPTWPTEWQLHSVMMAWTDYMYTGETTSLREFYEDLRVKTLIDLAREDGLISTQSERCTPEFEKRLHLQGASDPAKPILRDLVDWPPGSFTAGGTGERDNHEMRPINTVVNAFHCHALMRMSDIARALKKNADAKQFAQQATRVKAAINQILFDPAQGRYIDGEGSNHASLHSNMFMLAFDLVPDNRKAAVLSFVKSRGMACSVYGAQYLLEALYRNNQDQFALELMTARNDRSWWHILQMGTTITPEAWDLKYKNNLDWNHAWGAAPANIIPRFILGIRPLEPGFRKVLIQPHPGKLAHIQGTVPTIQGPIAVSLITHKTGKQTLEVNIPENVSATIALPRLRPNDATMIINNTTAQGVFSNGHLFLDNIGPGRHVLTSP
ncbi:MAG: alpha-L-rhamnosidase C-terminal domain-containing protein [Kiritimatiellia bacterium]